MVAHENFIQEDAKDELQTPLLLKTEEEFVDETPANKGDSQNDYKLADTLAGLAGNVIEWYDFSVFGFFADIIGDVMFPPQVRFKCQ